MYKKFTLDSGLRILLSKISYVKSVSVAIFIGAGGCFESEAEAGISHFLEHLCFKGTNKRPTSREITTEIEATGGIINGGTDKELTIFWCKVAQKYLPLAIDVLNDIIRNSKFDPVDIEKERYVIIEEINMNFDIPQQRVDTLIYELLWPNQAVGRDVLGSKDTIRAFTRKDILNFYHSHYLPGNTVISIAGDINEEIVTDILCHTFKGWDSIEPSKRFESYSFQELPRVKFEFRDIEQVHLCLGVHGFSLSHPDRFAIDILNVILGDGMSSRLFLEIRERLGLAYEIGSSADHFRDVGSLIIHAGVEPRQFDNAVRAIIDQLFMLKDDVTEIELCKAKELIKGRMLLALENTGSVANWLGAQEIFTGKVLTIEEIFSLVDNVKLADLKRVSDEIIKENKLNLAVVGQIKDSDSLYKLLKL